MKNLKLTKILFFLFCFYNLSICRNINVSLSYLISGKYELAELILKDLYLENINISQEKEILYYLSNVCYLNKKYKLAKKYYMTLLDRYNLDNSETKFIKFMLSECNFYLEEYNSVINLCDELLHLNDENFFIPYVYYNKILALYKIGDYNTVLTTIFLFKQQKYYDINNEIQQHVDYILAETWFAKGNYKNAIKSFQEFINKYENSKLVPFAKIRIATMLGEQKKYAEAETILKSIYISSSVSAETELIVKYNIAKMLVKQSKYNQAIKLYQQISEKNSDKNLQPYLWLNLAYCYYQTKNYNKAISLLRKIDENVNENLYINSIYLLALSYYNMQNYDESIKIFDKFLKKYPTTKWYHDAVYWLGLSYYNKREFKKSLQILKLLAENKSSIYHISSLIYTARAYKELKEFEQAKLLLSKLLTYKNVVNDKKLISLITYELAECYKLTADYETALQYYNKIVNSEETKISLYAKVSIAEIYNYLGKYDETKKMLEELLGASLLTEQDEKIYIKTKILYLTAKYNKGEYGEEIEDEILKLLQISKIDNDDKKFLLSFLVNIYSKSGKVDDVIKTIDKLVAITSDENERFTYEIKIIKLLDAKNMVDQMFNRISKIVNKYKLSQQTCLINYYLLKYYLKTDQQQKLKKTISKFEEFLPEDYNLFTTEEFKNLIFVCLNYDVNETMYFAENIIPYVKTIDQTNKIGILKTIIETMIKNNMFNDAIKVASVVKKNFTDDDTSVYVEYIIGRIYELAGKKKLAENVYKGIIEKYSSSEYLPKAYIALINFYNSEDKNDLAKMYEEQLLSKFSGNNDTDNYVYNKANNLFKEQKYEETIKTVSFVLNSKNKEIAALAQKLLADCYFNMGKYREAAVEYLRVIYLYSDKANLCAEAQFMVGLCAEKLKLYDEAKKAYQNSKTKYPNSLWAQEAELRLKQLK